MTPQASPPILDLYGGPRRGLYRPGWAAFGCAALALAYTIGVGRELCDCVAIFLPDRFNFFDMMRISAEVGLAATGLLCIGVLGLWVGTLARESVNEWPRAAMAMTAWTAAAVALVADGGWLVIDRPRSSLLEYVNFLENIYLPMGAMSLFFKALALAFAIVYALQLAAWLRNKKLAVWSLVVLGLHLLVTLAGVVLNVLELLAFHTSIGGGPAIFPFQYSVAIGQIVASILVVGYFSVIAFRLWRWRAVT